MRESAEPAEDVLCLLQFLVTFPMTAILKVEFSPGSESASGFAFRANLFEDAMAFRKAALWFGDGRGVSGWHDAESVIVPLGQDLAERAPRGAEIEVAS